MARTATGPIEWQSVTAASVRALLGLGSAPCLSLYLPTHRNVPDNAVDLPRYRHLVEALERALAGDHSRPEVERLIRPLRLLAADRRFWEHTHDGLAVLAADGQAHGFVLERPVEPLAVVSDRFHLLPLVRMAAALERWSVLALTSREAVVYEAEAWHDVAGGPAARDVTIARLEPLPLRAAEPPDRLCRHDVIDEETREPHRVYLGKGPTGRAAPQVVRGGMGSKQDDIDKDTEIFLRHVDKVVTAEVSQRTGLPLLLVAAGPLAATFRGISRNPRLIDEHVPRDPHLLSPADLAALVAPVLAALRARRVESICARLVQARDRGELVVDLAEIGRAAVAGRVATLYVEAERFEPGRFDRESGFLEHRGGGPADVSRAGREPAARVEDLLGCLAEAVLEQGGEVESLAATAMPVPSGAVAVRRF